MEYDQILKYFRLLKWSYLKDLWTNKWKFFDFTFLTVLTVNLLALTGDTSITWTSPMFSKLTSNHSNINPLQEAITMDQQAWIASLLNVGAIVGPWVFSMVANRFGRKKAMLCLAAPHIASYMISASSTEVFWFYIARIIGGMGVGGGNLLVPMYVSEIADNTDRGKLTVTKNIFLTLGHLLSYSIGPFVSAAWFNTILSAVPTIFFTVFLLAGPESPHFLVTKNKADQAQNVLLKLRAQNQDAVTKELETIRKKLENKEEGHLVDLFKWKTNRKALAISLVLIIAQQLSGINAVLFYTQDIFEAAVTDGIPSDVSSIILGVVSFCSTLGAPIAAARLGRRPLLFISCFGIVTTHLMLGIYFFVEEADVDVSDVFWLPNVISSVYMVLYNIGIGPLPWTLCTELFPGNVKSFAVAIVTFTYWLISFGVTNFFNDMNAAMGKGGTFMLFGLFCLLAGIFFYFYVPETKGKSFEEIENMLEENLARKKLEEIVGFVLSRFNK